MQSKDQFICNHLKLIDIEKEEELLQNRLYREKLSLKELQNRGLCLIKLYITSLRTGLYGHNVITFGHKWGAKQLPSTDLSNGDIVGIGINNEHKTLTSGVVLKCEQTSIDVTFKDINGLNEYLNDNQCFSVIKLSNDVTHRRLKLALNNLKKCSSNNLVEVLFGETRISEPNTLTKDLIYFNENLNNSQKEAIEFALTRKEVAIIHGPPGTGKTTTLIEFILQCVRNNGMRVLACAPSNVAVDNLVDKLEIAKQEGIVRLGHPARAFTQLQKFSLDAAISRSDDYHIVRDMRSEIDALVKKREFYNVRNLRKELKEREKKVVKQVLKNSKVVLSTLTSASSEGPLKQILENNERFAFDVVVIDECSQALEAADWIVLNYASKCVLAGDHKQLPPTIISEKAARNGLEVSLMERLLNSFENNEIVRMLEVQYRMNQLIMKWSAQQFYDNKLIAFETVANHSLNDIVVCDIPPLVLIDTAGCDMNELELEDEESKGNEYEADIVSIYVERLIEKGFSQSNIGIISPYNLQVDFLRARLKKYEKIEIKSVDGFQGREKEIIIISLVRSNKAREVGFLSEKRRINVAVTRAKRHLALVCDSDTVSNDSTIDSLIKHFNECGEIISAHEFMSDIQNLEEIPKSENLRFKNVVRSKASKSDKQYKQKEIDKQKDKTSNKYVIHDEKSDEMRKQVFQEKLENFVLSVNQFDMSFPPTLNSFERRVIHEIAESLNLVHESIGDGNERHIVIKKKYFTDLHPQNISHANSGNFLLTQHKLDVLNTDTQFENLKEEVIIEQNLKVNKDIKIKSQPKTHPKNIVKLPATTTSVTKKISLPDTEDIDELIASIKKLDNTCFYANCKTKIAVLGQLCRFCNHRFCLTHSMPEIHGCGEQVKAFVKSTIRKEGKLYPGSGIPSKTKSNPVKQDYLEKKLTKKLDEMSNERKQKSARKTNKKS